jgi:hypothetical protein
VILREYEIRNALGHEWIIIHIYGSKCMYAYHYDLPVSISTAVHQIYYLGSHTTPISVNGEVLFLNAKALRRLRNWGAYCMALYRSCVESAGTNYYRVGEIII